MDNPEPIVSVIIPTYNWSSALQFSIRSVLWQTLPEFELLVVGDGCTDDSEKVVASFGDPRIRWHNLPENTGNQPAANNAAIAMARGRYIAYLGHDDLWLPDHLARLAGTLDQSGADLAYSWIELIGSDPVQIRIICGISASGEYEPGTSLVPSCFMHRRAMVSEIGPWKDFRTILTPPDQEFIERAFRAGKKFIPVNRLTALKFPATWRPDSYVQKPVHQQADYARRILESPDFASDELHDMVEFLFRKYPAEIARNNVAENSRAGLLIENARRIRGLDPMPLAAPLPPLQYPLLREVIDLGSAESAAYLGPGWSGQEAGFRWTDGGETLLVFALDKISALQMRVRCAPLLVPGKLDAQTVVISCNGTRVSQWILTDWEMKSHAIHLDQGILEQHNVITFTLPNAAAPLRLLDTSTDFRHLALRIEKFEFERQ